MEWNIEASLAKIRDSSFNIGSVESGTSNFDLRALTAIYSHCS
jgi:hypothetical protein